MNEIRIELNSYNIIQIILFLCLFISIISFIIYYYINSSHEDYKKELSDNNSNLNLSHCTSSGNGNASFNNSFINNE